MADTTSKKTWWLVLRRTGYEDIKIKLPINWKPIGAEFDRLVDPALNTDDWEFYDTISALGGVSTDLKVRFEFIGVTQPFESASVVIT